MELTHLDQDGDARMVDVSGKAYTKRTATAQAVVTMNRETLALILDGKMPKGDVFSCARIAGILAAKHTSQLIPMCHPLPIDHVEVKISPRGENQVEISATVGCTYKTGVEMEALQAASTAALTIYDMCKAVDKTMVIGEIMLLKKSGGKSGDFVRGAE